MIKDRHLFIQWVRQHATWTEMLSAKVRQRFSALCEFSDEDGHAFMRFLRFRGMKFHSHASLQEKFESIFFMAEDFLLLRDNVFRVAQRRASEP